MRRFVFKLEKLHEIKKDIEFKAKLKYAFVLQKKINLEMENADMKKNIYQTIVNDNRNLNNLNAFDYTSMDINQKYIKGLESKIKKNDLLKIEIENELEKLKNELLEATRERKKLDQLEKKQHEEYMDKLRKHEIKQIDDIGGIFYERKRELLKQ